MIIKFLDDVIKKEKIDISISAVQKLVKLNYPSIRDMLIQLQDLSMNNKKIIEEDIQTRTDKEVELYDLIKNGDIDKARKEWLSLGIDCRALLYECFRNILKEKIQVQKITELVNICAKYDHRMANGADHDIQMFQFSIDVRKVFKE